MDRRLESKLELGIYRIVQRIIEQLGDSIDEFSVVLWRDEESVHLSLSQLPNLDKQQNWHLFQLLEVYAHAIQANLTIQHNETYTSIYLNLTKAIFQESIIPEVPKIKLDKLVNILAVSSDKDFLQVLNLDFEFKYKMANYLFVDLDSLFNQINLFQPQITILDISIAPEILKLLCQKTIVVLLSSNYDESFARQALHEGVMAIIPKLRVERELIPAIHIILQGEAYISVSLFMNRRKTEAKTSLNLDALLTLREREILDLILADLTHADIAARLVISPRTVEKHRANIMQKLGLSSHTELILFALRHGLITQQ